MKLKRLFFSLFFLIIPGAVFSPALADNEVGPGDDYYLIYNYKYDWLVYSPQYKNFVPYSKSIHEAELSASLLVDLLKNRRYHLLVTSSRENYLFIEGALQKKIEPDTWLTLNIDSLHKAYRKDEILLTLYGSPGITDKQVMVGHAQKSASAISIPKARPLSIINIKPIQTSSFDDFSILLILFLLLLTLFTYSTSPSLFRRFLSISDFVDLNERNDLYRFSRPYTRFMLFNALMVCTCMGYLILFLAHYKLKVMNSGTFLSKGDELAALLIDQIKLSGLFMFLLFVKYTLMGIVGSVLNLERVVNIHYIKALQVSYLFYGVITIVFFATSLQNPLWFEQARPYLLYIFIFYYLIRFVLLYIFINYSGHFINLYLFSYLCVIEVIPLIIGVKFAN